MSIDLERCLRELDGLLDPAWARQAEERIARAFAWREVDYLPVTCGCPLEPWVTVEPREYVWEKEKTLLYRLGPARDGALIGDDRLLRVGTLPDASLIPTMFGANLVIHRQEHWVHPAGDRNQIEQLIAKGVPDVLDGWGWKVVKECEFFLEAMGNHPNLRAAVKVNFADVQGPFDNACQVAGNDIYYWLLDAPDLVEALVNLMTETQLAWYAFLEQHFAAAFQEGRVSFCGLTGANVHLVVDHCENLSPSMYERFCRPSMEVIFARFGNRGSVHFCGKNKRIQECILDTPGVAIVDLRQPAPDDPAFTQRMHRLREKKIGFLYNGHPVIKPNNGEKITTGLWQCTSVETLEKARALLKDVRTR